MSAPHGTPPPDPGPARPPVILERARHIISRRDISADALKVLHRLHEAGYLAYLAGGGVRDLLLRRRPKDFDVATDAHPQQIRRLFRNSRLIGRRFRLVHVVFGDRYVEVSTFRALLREPDPAAHGPAFRQQDGVILRDNVFGTPAEDAFRRDFTVNALFYNVADRSVIDHVGGLPDLERRVLRVIGDPWVRFREDPARMVRAARFCAQLDFTLDPDARRAVLELHDLLALTSRERLYDEFLKILYSGQAERIVPVLREFRLLEVIFPEWSAWLDADPGARLAGAGRALRQMDIWIKAGLYPRESLAWAILLGEFHRHRAAELLAGGLPRSVALHRAVANHLRHALNHIQFSRHVVLETAQLMSVQPAFERIHGKQPEHLARRPCFSDALVCFKFFAAATGDHPELIAWWQQYLARP